MTRRHVPLTAQLNRIFGAVILLTCVILSVFSYRMNMQAHIASQTAQSVLLLRTMAQSINAQMAQVEIIAQETAYDEDVISLLRMERLPEQIVSIVATMDQKFQRTEAYLAGLGLDIVLLSEDDAAMRATTSSCTARGCRRIHSIRRFSIPRKSRRGGCPRKPFPFPAPY